jgi:hypothetical protein
MKRKAVRLSLMAVTFILVMQLFTPVPVSQAGQGNRKRTYSMRIDPETPSQGRGRRKQGNWCFRRCRRQYNRCLIYAGTNWGRRRACTVRFRNCVKRCD